MSKRSTRYWGYRIDTSNISFFRDELKKGRLRQGWGSNPGQDLRKLTVDRGAGRNRPMYDKVKKGDILLVPRLPNWEQVAIVEATEDWDKGYKFNISKDKGDYGHTFPARLVGSFSRNNKTVSGDIRQTLRTPLRFWNIDHLKADIQRLRNALGKGQDLVGEIGDDERLAGAVRGALETVFDEGKFGCEVYKRLTREFKAGQWENVLVIVFRALYPSFEVNKTDKRAEGTHGTDIWLSTKGLGQSEEHEHAIAVQVKDYEGIVPREAVDQIANADKGPYHVFEKVVVVIRASIHENGELVKYGNEKGVRLVFKEDLKKMITMYAKRAVGLDPED